MMRIFMLLVVVVSAVSTIGCSGSDAPSDSATATSNAVAAPNAATPENAVAKFLEAVRTGNADVASASLTPLALDQIKKNDMEFTPPASETAKFRIGKVEPFEQDKVFVESVWIEQDADGKPFEETMTWGLKLVDSQWRISGLAVHMGPDQAPIIYDFENPDQFIGVQDSAPAASQQSSPRQATQPVQDPFNQTISR